MTVMRLAPMALPPAPRSPLPAPQQPATPSPPGQQLSYSSALTNRELSRAQWTRVELGLWRGSRLSPVLSLSLSLSPILLQPHNGHDGAQI